jgi:hypothetical protein
MQAFLGTNVGAWVPICADRRQFVAADSSGSARKSSDYGRHEEEVGGGMLGLNQ